MLSLPTQSQTPPPPANFLPGEAAKRLVRLKNAPASGSQLTLAEHEMALFAGIAIDAIAIPNAAMTVETGGVPWTIASDKPFILMTGYSGADSAQFVDNTSVWCELGQREPRKQTKDKALIARLKKSHEQQVNLCLLDTGKDGSWDKVIVSAAKLPELRRSFDIAPAPYQAGPGGALPRSYIAVKFHHQNMFHTPRFYVEGFLLGKPIQVDSLTFTNPDGSFSVVPGAITTPPGELPRELKFGAARFTIAAIDSSTKTAEVRIDQAWGTEPVKITRISYGY